MVVLLSIITISQLAPAVTVGVGTIPAIGQYAIGQGFSYTQAIATQQGTPITATDWTMDNWGEDLLACPRGGLDLVLEPIFRLLHDDPGGEWTGI
jgi:hypothetical protein